MFRMMDDLPVPAHLCSGAGLCSSDWFSWQGSAAVAHEAAAPLARVVDHGPIREQVSCEYGVGSDPRVSTRYLLRRK